MNRIEGKSAGKVILSIFALIMLILPMVVPSEVIAGPSVKQLTFGTYNVGGGYMLLATAIAKIANDHVKYVNVTPVPSPKGGVENVETIDTGERDFGLATSNVVIAALNGTEPFRKKQNIMGWFNAHYTIVWSIVTESSGIKSFKDFKGKRIAIGGPGSNEEYLNTKVYLPMNGVDVSTVKLEKLRLNEAVELIKDGHLDGFILHAAPRLATITELASSRKIRFVPMEQGVLEKITATYKDYVIREIKQTDVPKLIMDTPSYKLLALNHIAIVRPSLEEQVVYDLTKAVFENLSVIHDVKEEFKVITLDVAVGGMPVVVHPGAIRYFREKGVIK